MLKGTQKFRAFVALVKLFPAWMLTTTFKPSSKKSDAFLWPLQAPAHVYVHTHAFILMYIHTPT